MEHFIALILAVPCRKLNILPSLTVILCFNEGILILILPKIETNFSAIWQLGHYIICRTSVCLGLPLLTEKYD